MLFPPPPPPAVPPRVVVTGAGIITALGIGWKPNAEGFRAGRPAFRPVSHFDVSRQRVKVAAEVDLPDALPPTGLSGRQVTRLDRAGAMLLQAACAAWQQAQWQAADYVPLVLGTTAGACRSERHITASRCERRAGSNSKPLEPFITRRKSRVEWSGRPGNQWADHDHLQRLRLREQCHRPRLGSDSPRPGRVRSGRRLRRAQ